MPRARFWDGSQWVVLDAKSAEKALDSDKLGGQLPSHYATADSVNTVSLDLTNHKSDGTGHNIASGTKNGFMSSSDFTKLSGIATGATKVADNHTTANGTILINDVSTTVYTHPASHPASMIDTDTSHLFVTQTQIDAWNNSQEGLGYTPENTANKGQPSGYASLDTNGLVPLSQLPANVKESQVVSNIAARDAIATGDKYTGLHVLVVDATGDGTVTTGGAEYVWNGTTWVKISESESMDIVLQWTNITGKPTSAVADIDDAVTKRHSHSNTAVLNATTASYTTELNTKLSGIADGATKVQDNHTTSNGTILINGTPITVYTHPATHTASEISDLTTTVQGIKVNNAISADFINNVTLFVQAAQPANPTTGKTAIWIDSDEAAL